MTKNSATAKAVALFLAGAEGLEPSARGFGVDVGESRREREKGCVGAGIPARLKTGGAVLVLPGKNPAQNGQKSSENDKMQATKLTVSDKVRIIKSAGDFPPGRLLQTGG